MNQLLASFIGFLCGVGITAIYYQWRDQRAIKKGIERRHHSTYRNGSPALVVRDNSSGEPEVDRTLIKPSPVPGWLAVILVLLGVGTVASTIVQNQRNSETRKSVRVAQCQNFAQLKFRGDETRAGYLVLSQAIRKLENPRANPAETASTLATLADYYQQQGQDPGGLPPLSSRALSDCADGVFNDGYPNSDSPPVAPPASAIPQASLPSS